MSRSLDAIIAEYERKHGHAGEISLESEKTTDVDLADLRRRVIDIAKGWTSDQIKEEKGRQQAQQEKTPSATRQAVIDGLQDAATAKATGQDGT
jgi:hypothetical protein